MKKLTGPHSSGIGAWQLHLALWAIQRSLVHSLHINLSDPASKTIVKNRLLERLFTISTHDEKKTVTASYHSHPISQEHIFQKIYLNRYLVNVLDGVRAGGGGFA